MNNPAPALTGRGLHKRFLVKESKQTVTALRDVSLQVESGSLMALVGPDGAGKTTLLRLAAGLMTPDEGELLVLGIDAAKDPQAIQNRISYMPQRFGLYEDLSVQENLDLYADLHGVPAPTRRQRYARLMEMTDLGRFTHRLAGKLSGGMKQKLGLACTLVRSPDLLLLDEPTVGVDPLSRQELWEILGTLVNEERLTVLVSTAYLDEAARCAQVLVLHEGKAIANGTPASIRERAEGLCFVAQPPADEPPRVLQSRLLDDPDTLDAVPRGGEVRFIRKLIAVRERDSARIDALLQGAACQPVSPTLEDGFMVLLRSQDTRELSQAAASTPVTAHTSCDEIVIEVRDLVRKFGDFIAVNNTTFSVRRGEIFGLLGPNGAGKTTLLKAVSGLLPWTGEVTFAGASMAGASPRDAVNAGLVHVVEGHRIFTQLTVEDNVLLASYGMRSAQGRKQVEEALDFFPEIKAKRHDRAVTLSGGQQQMLAVTQGLVRKPKLLMLDEPSAGLSPVLVDRVLAAAAQLRDAGTAVLLVEQLIEKSLAVADRVYALTRGTMVLEAPANEAGLPARLERIYFGQEDAPAAAAL